MSSFIGRENDLAVVEQMVSTSRLVTITGTGGSGKTRLSLQVADKLSHAFADGVWFFDLTSLRDPTRIPEGIAQSLGLRPATDQHLLEFLAQWIAPRNLCLVLDNCEHLAPACAHVASHLLGRAGGLHILATSREPLAVKGEMVYPLQGLSLPPGRSGLSKDFEPKSLLTYDAIRLFVERARAISPGFALTADNIPAVEAICQRLDGLPLAIELASARANVLAVGEIASRLSNRLEFLSAGQRHDSVRNDIDPRHRTLRAAIDWSHDLLTAAEQAMLRRLSVFSAGCTLDTAEAVCDGDGIEHGSTLDLLTALVDRSLIIAETTGRAQARYRLLETIREYAQEKLEASGESRRLRDRHLALFVARAEEAAPKLGDAYQQLWLNWLEGEHENLRSALDWSLESGQIEAGLRLVNAIPRYLEIRGYVPEGMAWYKRLLARVDECMSLKIRTLAFTYASHIAMFLSDIEASAAFSREAVATAEAVVTAEAVAAAGENEGPILLISALGGLTSSADAAGDFETAYIVGERTIQLIHETPSVDRFLVGMSYLGVSNICVKAGHSERARELIRVSMEMAQEDGDAYRMAHCHTTMGSLLRREGNYTGSLAAYAQSVRLLRELDARHDIAAILRDIGSICLVTGDGERARAHFIESLELHQAEQNLTGMIESLIGVGSAAVIQGSPDAGVRLLTAGGALRSPRTKHVWPACPMEMDPYLALARAQLSEPEFQAEQAAGQSMTLKQAAAFAHALLRAPDDAGNLSPVDPGGLTGRERDVVLLIARGLSNRDIAGELVISPRTVEKHVANILSRLGFTRRAQIVRWAVEHGLTSTAAVTRQP